MPSFARVVGTPLGLVRLVAEHGSLTVLELPRVGSEPQSDAVVSPAEADVLDAAARQLAEYFGGTRRDFDLPLAPAGSPFQRVVWDALLGIPYATTTSYVAIAQAIGRPSASRAVGAANGKNPLAIIVPCHRVIGASGALTGYGGGLPGKRWLLAHEARTHRPGHAGRDSMELSREIGPSVA